MQRVDQDTLVAVAVVTNETYKEIPDCRSFLRASQSCALSGPSTKSSSGLPIQVQFELPDMSGKLLKPADFAGKVVLLDIWASWCGPCNKALPLYADLQRELSDQNFQVIAVSVDEDRAALVEYLKDKFDPDRLPFVVLHDQKGELARELRVDTMPTTYILDENAKMVFVHRGFNGNDDLIELRAKIQNALSSKKSQK